MTRANPDPYNIRSRGGHRRAARPGRPPGATALALFLALASCERQCAPDAGLDGGPVDLRAEQRGDGRRDGVADLLPTDAGVERGADLWREAGSDALAPDAALPVASVLYTAAADPDSFGLRTVETTSRQPAVVSGFNGGVDLERLLLTGQQETLALTAGRAQPLPLGDKFAGIALPGGAGTLYSYHRLLLGTSGVLLVRGDGSFEPLVEVPGIYGGTLSEYLGLSTDGRVGAVLRQEQTVVLFRSDGQLLANGQSSVELAASDAGLETLAAQSLTLAGGWLYAVGQDADGQQQLLRAPLDGSASLAEVLLPAGAGGEPPSSFALQLARDAAGEQLVVSAGSGIQLRDLYLVQAASGQARRLTDAPGAIPEQGSLGQQSGKLAVSPAASRIAFVRTVGGLEELYVIEVSGGPAQQLSGDAFFDSGVGVFMSLVFADEENLFFWAGLTSFEADLYHWSPSSGVSSLSGAGGLAPPFHGLGYFMPQGTWTSPNGRWRYWVIFQPSNQQANIIGVEQGTRQLSFITRGVQVQVSPGALTPCGQDGQLYFAARPSPAVARLEVYRFDQNQGSPATQLTAISPPATNSWNARSLRLSPGCEALVWAAGPGVSYQDLFVLPLASPGPPRKLVNLVGYFSESLTFTPDGQGVIFGSGLSGAQATLKAVPLAGGNPTLLDPAAGTINIFAVY